MTDEERRRIALRKYAPDLQGRFPTWENLADEFHYDERTVREAFKMAFAQGLVKVVSTPTPPPVCNRARSLEQDLKRRYARQLRAAIVVDVSPISKEVGASGPQFDEAVHRVLGHEMANVIGEGLIFETGDRIGVGAGRGVYYTVDSLCALCAASQPLFSQQISIVSLTGSVEATSYIADVPYHMDADLAAMNLMRCFTGATARFVSSSIAPENRSLFVRHTPLAEELWNELRPTHALVGVGVLAAGHRFFSEVEDPKPDSSLMPIRAELQELVEFCRNIKVPGDGECCPVGDLCHRLFFMPPAGMALSTSIVSGVNKLIEKINSRMLNVSDEQLKSINNIIVVAGTRRKALAIRELLNNGKYNIRYLCTDSTAAEKILEG